MSAISLPKLPAIASSPIAVEVLNGLTERPKTLSPWLFYDEAGSRLFEEITELPEYYVTRTERQILAQHADEIVAAAAGGRDLSIIELGAGTATKTGLLLNAAVGLQGSVTYYPIDVSETALEEARTRLEAELPEVTVEPIVADYTEGMRQNGASHAGRRLVLYIGSSIGNFSPADAVEVLRGVRAQLLPGDCLLLGTDMVKDTNMLLAAYDDAAGVTARFNMNVLVRINRELDANFNPKLFRHQARWNEQHSRIEMHLESLLAQKVALRALDMEVRFGLGETIHTENSYKFTDQRVAALLTRAGFKLRQQWSDPRSGSRFIWRRRMRRSPYCVRSLYLRPTGGAATTPWRGTGYGVAALEFAQVLCLPDVARLCAAGKAYIAQLDGDGQCGVVAVEEAHGFVATLEWLSPDFDRTHFRNTIPLLAQRILIDGDHFFVGQDGSRLRLHLGEVVARQQRRREQRP